MQTNVSEHERTNLTNIANGNETSDLDLRDSRISKLWVQRLTDKRTVFNWDRGMDVPADDEIAAAASPIADHIYAE